MEHIMMDHALTSATNSTRKHCICIDYIGAEVCAGDKLTLAMYECVTSQEKYLEWHLSSDPVVIIPWAHASHELKTIWWVIKHRGSDIILEEDGSAAIMIGPHLLRCEDDFVIHTWYDVSSVPIGKVQILEVPCMNRISPTNTYWVYNVLKLNAYNDKWIRMRQVSLKTMLCWKEKAHLRRLEHIKVIQKIVWDHWMERALRPGEGALFKYYENQFYRHVTI